MSDNKKYYYLKLKEDFFDSEEMKVLESMKNGVEYQNVYLKMCLLSLKSDGALLFKNMLPYSLEMLSSVLRVNVDTIKTAIEIFQKIGLITITDTETIYMTDIQTLVGQSSTEAERVKKYRQNLAQKKQESIECINDVQMYNKCTENVQNCTPEIRDKSIEIRDKSIEIRDKIHKDQKTQTSSMPKFEDFQKEESATADMCVQKRFAYSEYTDLHTKLFKELVAAHKIPDEPLDYNYGAIARNIKKLLSNPYFTKEKIFKGIKNAMNDPASLEKKFALLPMLTEANMTRLIEKRYITTSSQSKYQKPRGCESINGAPKENYLNESF